MMYVSQRTIPREGRSELVVARVDDDYLVIQTSSDPDNGVGISHEDVEALCDALCLFYMEMKL